MKKRIITLILLLVLIISYLIFKPFIVSDFKIYYKNDTIGDYTLYKANYNRSDEALETIYDDGDNIYYFSSVISDHFILVKHNKKLTLQEALEQGLVTPEELMNEIKELRSRDHDSES